MISKVLQQKNIKTTADLAHKIWNQHYVAIIGQEQVDYMLYKFQSQPMITSQIETGYEYYLISEYDIAVGYLALLSNIKESKMIISKIYINAKSRGNGFGKKFINFTIKECKQRNIKTLWLTVNKHNKNSIYWYKKLGFKITQEIKTDIGNGYFMDDYIMEKTI